MNVQARRFDPRLVLVGAVAFVTHASYSLLAAPEILPVSDANAYRLLAEHLAEGRGYIRPYDFAFDGVIRPTADFPPGFAAFLSVFHRLGIDAVREQRILLAVVGSLTAVGVALLARRWLPAWWALGLGLISGVHPALFQPGSALLSESLFVAGITAVLLAAVRLRESPSVPRAMVLGLAGGAAGLVRSEGLVVTVLVGLAVLLTAASGSRARPAGAFVLALALLPGGWAARNLATFDEPVLLSNNIGSVLAGANCDATYHGDLVGFWVISEDCFRGFTDQALSRADESVVSRELRDQGLRYAREHLSRAPVVAAVRVLRVFQLWDPEQQARLATFEGRELATERVAGWLTWLGLGLATVGMVRLGRSGDRTSLALLVAPILVVILLAASTQGNSRMRIAAEVPLLLLSAIAVHGSIEARASRVTDDSDAG